MPSPSAVIGAALTAYVPDDTDRIALGYTHVRFYVASSEAGSYSLAGSVALVANQLDYSYNHTTATATSWFYWCLYGATPGEGPTSEPVPVGGPQSTRKQIRQGVGRFLRILDVVTVASSASATTFIANDLIDPDASAHRFANRFARPVSGSYSGNTRRVRTAANTGYAPATGTITVGRTFGGTLDAGDEIELWRPKGDEDPSILIDEAMQRARLRVWWEDTWLLTTDASVTEYALPAIFDKAGQVKAADWATGTYPSEPMWSPVPYWNVYRDMGIWWLTCEGGGLSRLPFSAGTVIRLLINRHGDRMDSDTDYWDAPLEWCIAETALEFLDGLASPSGGFEDVVDVDRARKVLERQVASFRSAYMPEARPHVVLAR